MTRGTGRTVYQLLNAAGKPIGEYGTYSEATWAAIHYDHIVRIKAVHVDDADAEPKPEERKP